MKGATQSRDRTDWGQLRKKVRIHKNKDWQVKVRQGSIKDKGALSEKRLMPKISWSAAMPCSRCMREVNLLDRP